MIDTLKKQKDKYTRTFEFFVGISCIESEHIINAYLFNEYYPEFNDGKHICWKITNFCGLEGSVKPCYNWDDKTISHWFSIGNCYIVIQHIDDKWLPDIEKFINGQYSQLSEELKKDIISRYPKAKVLLYPTEEAKQYLKDKLKTDMNIEEILTKIS